MSCLDKGTGAFSPVQEPTNFYRRDRRDWGGGGGGVGFRSSTVNVPWMTNSSQNKSSPAPIRVNLYFFDPKPLQLTNGSQCVPCPLRPTFESGQTKTSDGRGAGTSRGRREDIRPTGAGLWGVSFPEVTEGTVVAKRRFLVGLTGAVGVSAGRVGDRPPEESGRKRHS